MAIVAADLEYRHSGGAANNDGNASLGGAKSANAIDDGLLHELFDAVSGAEHAAGDVEYRCVYLHNDHATLTLTGAVAWIESDTTGAESDISIGVGSAAVNGTEPSVANESTAPGGGVTFSDAAVSRATGLALGDIPAGQHKAVWIRWTVTAGSTPQAADAAAIRFGGDTL